MMTDSTFREIKAFYKVRFYRADIQGISDSIHYSSRDSMIYMRGDPVLWNESNQILGNEIDIFLNDSTIDKAHIRDFALAIQDRQVDEQYNQLSGRDMTAFFQGGELHHLLVEGEAESLYYLVEEDSTIIGLNRTESPYLSMDFENDQLKKLKVWPTATGTTTPLSLLKPDQSRLGGFVWLDYLRPLGAYDIFRGNQRRSSETRESQRRFQREDITL